MANQITNIKATNEKASSHLVHKGHGQDHWIVISGSSATKYHVRLAPFTTCTCDWAKFRPEGTPCGCSHVQAAIQFAAKVDGYRATIRSQYEPTDHLHRKTEVVGDGIKVTMRKVADPTQAEKPEKPAPTAEEIDSWFSY